MKCENCGKENRPEASVCEECGAYLNTYPQKEEPVTKTEETTINDKKKVSFGLKLISFLFPIIGLILFVAKKNDDPATSKACGKSALISVILSVIVTILFGVFAVVGFVNLGKDAVENGDITINGEVVEDYDTDDSEFEFEYTPEIEDDADEVYVLDDTLDSESAEEDFADEIPAIE